MRATAGPAELQFRSVDFARVPPCLSESTKSLVPAADNTAARAFNVAKPHGCPVFLRRNATTTFAPHAIIREHSTISGDGPADLRDITKPYRTSATRRIAVIEFAVLTDARTTGDGRQMPDDLRVLLGRVAPDLVAVARKVLPIKR